MNDFENKNPYQDENGNLNGNQEVNQNENGNPNGYQNPYQSGNGNSNGYQNPYQSGSGNQYNTNEHQNPYQSEGDNSNGYQNPYQSGSGNYDMSGGYSSDYNNGYNDIPPKKGNGLAVTSMVLGILSVTVCCCIPVINLIFAIVALVLGIIAQKNNPNGMALAGIITAAFGLIFGVIINISFFSGFIDAFNSALDEITDSSFFEDSSSFDNNNNAIIGAFNLIKRILGL